MIFIIANESDLSVNSVIEWLIYFNIEFTRTNDIGKLENTKNGVFWIRKNIVSTPLVRSVFRNNFCLTKDYVSDRAKRLGLLTPNQYLGTEVNKALSGGRDLIMKPRDNVTSVFFRGEKRVNYSTRVNREILNAMSLEEKDNYLFQDLILADFELRVFFIKSKIYSCALVRREYNDKAFFDVRYEMSVKNIFFERYVLPKQDSVKITELFNSMNLDFGCVDFLVKDGKHYFLEINQLGQFEEYSKKANLLIEKEIALQLIYHEQKYLS